MTAHHEILPVFEKTVSVATRKVASGWVRVRVTNASYQQNVPVALTDDGGRAKRFTRLVVAMLEMRVEGERRSSRSSRPDGTPLRRLLNACGRRLSAAVRIRAEMAVSPS